MIRFIGRVCVGFLVSIPIVCILAGGMEQGFMLLFLSIVCTAGIGLVVWIPVWWIAGVVTQAILGLFTTTVEDTRVAQSPTVSVPRNLARRAGNGFRHDVALTAYIRQAMASGMDADEMTRRLQLNGWATGEIQGAHARFISSQSKAKR